MGDVPGGSCHAGDPILRCDEGLINGHLGKLGGLFVPIECVCLNGRDIDITPKVARQITEVGSLFNHRACTVQKSNQNHEKSTRGTNLLDLSHQSSLAIAS